ncbi:hypothetical protein ROZALSC1DRAFT_28620 [Rozella allomycis CSF55]|uniref:Rad52/22 double-strand break repair protein domain-containing protein n=1 Tax=Rozella allomycis (strain CSF55) TaxID=988480 RepID=A0A075AUC6_ROZAC|nr:Rad52/22 double-strand break repair protein domain-containing protein [Rozella allomycis CSF55]RKP19831.1 hypothetical protein ROZALSC1DRAFT_28620 [Rozella allomycis CSF55]|eukprot:EPZ33873.1 Rad52/22 double-strand break repair protein domain-containing protein [Rozella allomycis CSF55]
MFGSSKFDQEDFNFHRYLLDLPLSKEHVSFKNAPGGNNVGYIEGWRSIKLANDIFGFNGWSSSILDLTVDFIDEKEGKFSVGVSCLVRIFLKDGSFHDDIGYGNAENMRSKGLAIEKAKKEACTDAVKRCLRNFGQSLGNCLYDKSYASMIKRPQNNKGSTEEMFTSADNAKIKRPKINENIKIDANEKPRLVDIPTIENSHLRKLSKPLENTTPLESKKQDARFASSVIGSTENPVPIRLENKPIPTYESKRSIITNGSPNAEKMRYPPITNDSPNAEKMRYPPPALKSNAYASLESVNEFHVSTYKSFPVNPTTPRRP